MADIIDSMHGEPNGTRLILHRNRYNEKGLLVGMEAIKELASEDAVEVRHGTWLEDRYNDLDYVCSECGEPCAGMVMGKPRDRYCKWCGARMDGEWDG